MGTSRSVRVGLAYCDYVAEVLEAGAPVDYIEVPYELLKTAPDVVDLLARKDLVLHCASLSVAGSILPERELCEDIAGWIERTRSPWLGEHLSFVLAEPDTAAISDEYAPGQPYNIGYTVSPAYNAESVQRVTRSTETIRRSVTTPIILENAPIYVPVPGTTMLPAEFMGAVSKATDTGILLDLAHWFITCRTLELDPFKELEKLPFDRVVEAHVSGVDPQDDMVFDNHASTAPVVVIDLLTSLCERAPQLQAVTLEYNWSSTIPTDVLCAEIERVRKAIRPFRR